VTGLVRGRARGYFKLIMDRLRDSGYAADAAILDASWLGVPQARQRVFIVGVRSDLGADPDFPDPLPYRYTVRDALGDDLTVGPPEEILEADITRFAIGPEWDSLKPGGKSERYFSLMRSHPAGATISSGVPTDRGGQDVRQVRTSGAKQRAALAGKVRPGGDAPRLPGARSSAARSGSLRGESGGQARKAAS
jgi:site-specific DNA-cytosine methylase